MSDEEFNKLLESDLSWAEIINAYEIGRHYQRLRNRRRMTTNLGFLKTNDHFILDGKEYRVGHVIDKTNGYVACIDVETKKVKRVHIDVEVEEVIKV